MQLRTIYSVESQTAGRQLYVSGDPALSRSTLSFNIMVPGASSCCEGCSSTSCVW